MNAVDTLTKKPKSNRRLGDETLFVRSNITKGLRWTLVVLIGLILWSGIAIVEQTQHRHQVYKQIRTLDLQLAALKTEEQRLMIEQQTFSATPQVASRAVGELGMFFPSGANRRVLSPQVNPVDAQEQTKQVNGGVHD